MISFLGATWLPFLSFLPALMLATNGIPTATISWWTGNGPAVAYEDGGQIIHSPCNIYGTVHLPRDSPFVLETPRAPRVGTPLAAAGWLQEDISQVAFFYQATDGQIHHCLYVCDTSTGRYRLAASADLGENIARLSGTAADINPQTNLAVALSETDRCFRLVYHAQNMSIVAVNFNFVGQATSLKLLGGSPSGYALSAGYLPSSEAFYVAAPSDDQAIEISRSTSSNDTNRWMRFPSPKPPAVYIDSESEPPCERDLGSLPTWKSTTGTLGVVTNSDYDLAVFYIGSDQMLHSMVVNADDHAEVFDLHGNASWPTADHPNGAFGVTGSPRGEIWVFYEAQGKLTQVYFDGEAWADATPVPTTPVSGSVPSITLSLSETPTQGSDKPPSSLNSTSSESTGPTTNPSDSSPHQLPKEVTAGIAVGVVFGTIGIVIVIVSCVMSWRTRKEIAAEAKAQADFDAWRPCDRPSLQHIRPYSFTGLADFAVASGEQRQQQQWQQPEPEPEPEPEMEPELEPEPEPEPAQETGQRPTQTAEPAVAAQTIAKRPTSGISNPDRIGMAL